MSTIKFRPLRADEVEVRVAQASANGASLLLYKTARTDMDLLDEVVGPENWQNEFYELGDKLFCRLGIKVDEHWIWKSDCGVEGNAGEEKSQASDARKRAGFAWGIGRELYRAPFIWANVATEQDRNGRWRVKGFPKFDVRQFETDGREVTSLEIVDDKGNTIFRHGKALKSARSVARPSGQVASPAQAPVLTETFDEERADDRAFTELDIALADLRAAKSRADVLHINNQYKATYGKYGSAQSEEYCALLEEMSKRYPRNN